jgi:hypothetical protein
MKHQSYTYRMGMHKSQHLSKEVANEARAWMDHIRPMVSVPYCNLWYVINMDQTPVSL